MKTSAREPIRIATEGALIAISMPNGRYAAIWVIEVRDPYRVGRKLVENSASFVVLAGHWDALPGISQLSRAPLAVSRSVPDPQASSEWKGCFWGALPADFVVVGTKPPTPAALALVKESSGTMVFENAERLRAALFMDWRIEHDRAAVEEEWRMADAARAALKADRGAKMTLPQLLQEKPFGHWRKRWPLASVRAARAIFSEATQALIALDGGTKRQRTAILKEIVTRFNALYDERGCIETVEANEIVARVEQLARLVGLSNDDEVLTGHRDW